MTRAGGGPGYEQGMGVTLDNSTSQWACWWGSEEYCDLPGWETGESYRYEVG